MGHDVISRDYIRSMSIYREEDFYIDNGAPTEEYRYCAYRLPAYQDSEFESDYDQFALVVNALYPYVRLARIKGNSRLPCGLSNSPATDGTFARLTNEGRDAKCPKIAWGIAAEFVANLDYSDKQQDYVLCLDEKELYSGYYSRYWKYYESNHSGLKYSRIPIEQKEIDFISEHLSIEDTLWGKSSPLKIYGDLYQYALNAKKDYERFVLERKKQLQDIMKPKINGFSTEIRSSFDTNYVKVFFLDDTVAPRAQERVQALNCVRIANLTNSNSSAHPGTSLTVYPKPMVTAEYCEQEIKEELIKFFSNGTLRQSARPVKTNAYFDQIENQVLRDLDGARVSIYVAMAWFTNQRIADKLIEKFNEGLDVKVVSYDDHTNTRFGVNLASIPHKMIRSTRGGTMHDKFCVIDNQKVLTVSYNWSVNAENKNDENVAVIYDDARASDYSVEFKQLFDTATEN